MPARKGNPQRVKQHRTYSAAELATCCGVHKNTVRHWQANGLQPVSTGRPTLFAGGMVRAFLTKRNASRKRPSQPGMIFCVKCRQNRAPAMGMIEATRQNATTGNLRALCEVCGSIMNRRTRLAAIPAIMPNLDVQIREAGPRLCERTVPSLNCDNRKD